MRIAVVCDLLRANGASIVAATQARMLGDAGEDVYLLSGASNDPGIDAIVSPLRHAAFLPSDHPLDKVIGPDRVELGRDLQSWLESELRSFDPDVVVVHNVGRIFDQCGVAMLSHEFPVVAVLHDEWLIADAHYVTYADGELELSYEPHTSADPLNHDVACLWSFDAAVGRFVAVSPSRWLQHRWNAVHPSIPCFRIPNPVDESALFPVERSHARRLLGLESERAVVGFVGHPSATRKGFDLLERAIDTMNHSPIVVIVGGDQPWVPHHLRSSIAVGGWIDQRVTSSALTAPIETWTSRCITLGSVGRADLAMVLSAFDLVVHPSRMENLPTVPIEAQCCGVPCLVSSAGGSAETVLEPDMVVAAGSSAPSLGRRIGQVLERVRSEDHQDRLDRSGAIRREFSPEAHLGALRQVLTKVARR